MSKEKSKSGQRSEKPKGPKYSKDKGKPERKSAGKHSSKPFVKKAGAGGKFSNKPDQRGPRPKQPKLRLRGGAVQHLWGQHAVEALWLNPERTVHSLYLHDKAARDFASVIAEAGANNITRPEPQIVDRKVLDATLGAGAVHQGVLCEADPLPECFLEDELIAAAQSDSSLFLILDQVTDPHNVGAIIRSAAVFGAAGIIMQTRHAPGITGTLAKSACGGVEHIKLIYETNLGRACETLRSHGYQVIGLDERGTNGFGKVPPNSRRALVLGAEGKGVRPSIKEQCDELVALPTGGAISSLNVSNAAAVALYALKVAPTA